MNVLPQLDDFNNQSHSCLHLERGLFRVPFRRRDGTSSYHLIEICLACQVNVHGSGRWVSHRDIPNPAVLPLLQPTLFNVAGQESRLACGCLSTNHLENER